MQAYAECIRGRREELRLSKAQLAAKVGVDRITIHRWETGTHKPSRALRPLLASALDVPPSRLAAWFA